MIEAGVQLIVISVSLHSGAQHEGAAIRLHGTCSLGEARGDAITFNWTVSEPAFTAIRRQRESECNIPGVRPRQAQGGPHVGALARQSFAEPQPDGRAPGLERATLAIVVCIASRDEERATARVAGRETGPDTPATRTRLISPAIIVDRKSTRLNSSH